MKIRKAFVMSVNAGAEQEYEERHHPIWPELEKVLPATPEERRQRPRPQWEW